MEAKVIVTTELQLKAIVADAVSAALKYYQPVVSSGDQGGVSLYGDFKWLCETCSSVPASTLRIKSATGEIPGVIKLGKRVLYEKAVVLEWLRSQTRPISSAVALEQAAGEQFTNQLSKKGGRKTV